MAPNITEYTNKENVSPAPIEGTAYSLERLGRARQESIDAGVGSIAATGTAIGEAYEKHQARSEMMDFQAKSADYEVQKMQDYETKKAAAGNDTSWVSGWLDEYKKGLGSLGEKYGTPAAQTFAEDHAAEAFSNMGRRAFAEAANTEQEGQIANAHSTVQTLANGAAIDFQSTQTLAARAAKAAALVPGAKREGEIKTAMAHVTDSGLEAAVAFVEGNPNTTPTDVEAMKNYLSDEKMGFTTYASEGKFSAAMARLDNLHKFRQTTQFAADETYLGDLNKQMEQNGGIDQDNRGLDAIRNHQGATTEETLKWQSEHLNDYNKAQAYGREKSTLTALPVSAGLDHLADLKRVLDSAPLEDAGPARTQYEAAEKFIKDRDAEIGGNGLKRADYFSDARNYPANAKLLDDFQKAAPDDRPLAFQKFADASVLTQKAIDPGRLPAILPSALRENVAQRLNAVPNTPDGASQAASILGELQRTTGAKYWNQAVHELQTTGVLKPGQSVGARLIGQPQSMALAQEVLRATSIAPKDLNTLSPVTEVQARQAIDGVMGEFKDTFRDNVDGPAILAEFSNAGIAVLRARGNIADASSVMHQMILGDFQVKGGLRIPNSINASAATNMTARVQQDIGKLDLQVPPSFSGLNDTGQRAQFVQDIVSAGRWSTNPQGDGAVLYRDNGAPVRLSNGKQVEVKWKDIQDSDRSYYDQLVGNPTGVQPNGVPQAPAEQSFSGAGNFEHAFNYVLGHEGQTGKVTTDSGGMTKYGVSARAHPEIKDISKLTLADARNVYKAQYWDAIGADKLAPSMQGPALDAAVNQGVARTKHWLAQSKGDLKKFNALREAAYRETAKNPKQAGNLKGWLARIAHSYKVASND